MPQVENSFPLEQKIAIIGGGWYGCETAQSIKTENPEYSVTLFEKNAEIFSGISGIFGNRLHVGSHYPRSSVTREFCHQGYKEFYERYPELINEHSHSIYGLGIIDAEGNPPKVNKEEFAAVCNEFGNAKELESDNKYSNMQYVVDIKEPSLAMGVRLRSFFKKKLEDLGVELHCNFYIVSIDKRKNDSKFILKNEKGENFEFDHIINATSYQALLPKEPLDFSVFYQACFALVYKQNVPSNLPFSFIVMDGGFPSLMPYDDRADKSISISKYILTHASITISKQCSTFEEAENVFAEMAASIDGILKLKCEDEIKRFYPGFGKEFTYITYMGAILAKIRTSEDFRGAVTFKAGGVIYIVPGKISNVFQVSREVLSMLKNSQNIIEKNNYSYIRNGILDCSNNLKRQSNNLSQSTNSTKSQNSQESSASSCQIPDSKVSFFRGNSISNDIVLAESQRRIILQKK